jgi:hypothetical protein
MFQDSVVFFSSMNFIACLPETATDGMTHSRRLLLTTPFTLLTHNTRDPCLSQDLIFLYTVGSSLLINVRFLEIDIEFSELHNSVLSVFIECRNQDVLKLKLHIEFIDPLTKVIQLSVACSFFEMVSRSSVAGSTCLGSRTCRAV